MAGQPWSRREVLAAFNLYLRTPFGRLHARNPEIVEVAERLGRTPDALAMKCCNLAALDPALRERGIKGLRGVSRVDRQLWEDFEKNPESIGFDSELSFSELRGSPPRMIDRVDWEVLEGDEKEAITRIRVNQHLFRGIILAGYRNACAICSMPCPELLVAAHIVGWAADPIHRMNPRNGICLCAIHDRAYDGGFLSVDETYTIKLRNDLLDLSNNEAVRDMLVRYDGRCILLPDRWKPDPALLRRHTELLAQAS